MDIEKLKVNIWKTRKARINTSERLYGQERHMQYFNIYYTCVIVALSIYSLAKPSYALSIATVMSSVILTILSVYLNSQRFSQRAGELKVNYIEMHKLSLKLEHLSNSDTEQLCEIEDKYCELLHQCENQREIDYFRLKISAKEKLEGEENILFWWHRIILVIMYLVLILIPFFAVACIVTAEFNK